MDKKEVLSEKHKDGRVYMFYLCDKEEINGWCTRGFWDSKINLFIVGWWLFYSKYLPKHLSGDALIYATREQIMDSFSEEKENEIKHETRAFFEEFFCKKEGA